MRRQTVRVEFPWRLRIGEHSTVGDDAWLYTLERITIGAHCVISQKAFLCTGSHDVEDPHMQLIVESISIEDGAWVAADVFIAPGVTVGEGSVIGARSTVLESMPPGFVCYGYPCKPQHPRTVRGAC